MSTRNIRLLGYFFLLGLLISLISCRVCENVQVGEVTLSETAQQFLDFNTGEEYIFSNENEEEVTMFVVKNEGEYHICHKVTCRPVDPYKSNYCEYVKAPLDEVFFSTDSLLLGLDASIFAYEPETDLFYEAIRFQVSHVNEHIQASYISDVRFDDPVLDPLEINDINNYVLQKEQMDINGNVFTDVFYFETEALSFYATKDQGFIAYKLGKALWIRKN